MTKRTVLRRLLPSVAALFAAAALAAPAIAADFTMKIGTATFKDVQHQWADWYKEAVEQRTGGRIEVKVFPQSQLGPIPRQIEGVQLGTIEAFVAPTDFFVGLDPRFGVFSIPAAFRDKQHAAKVIHDPELNAEILKLGADKGLNVVSTFTHSVAHYFAMEPIRTLADFKGKKMRINATAAEREKMRRFGATAVPMPLNEVVPSLQRGVIDGTMSGTVIYVIFKFSDLGKVLTQTNDTMIVSAGVVSQAWLDKLPADLRQIVIEEGNKLQARTTEFSHVQEAQMIETWKSQGGEIVELPEADQKKIRDLLADVGETVTKDDPALKAFYGKVAATGAKY